MSDHEATVALEVSIYHSLLLSIDDNSHCIICCRMFFKFWYSLCVFQTLLLIHSIVLSGIT